MKIIDSLIRWAQSLGTAGAFFIITLAGFALCAMALWVVQTALKRGTHGRRVAEDDGRILKDDIDRTWEGIAQMLRRTHRSRREAIASLAHI